MHSKISTLKESIINLKKSSSKAIAIYITNFAVTDEKFLFNGIKESKSHLIAFAEVKDNDTLKELISTLISIEDLISAVIFDAHISQTLMKLNDLRKPFTKAKSFIYSEQKSWSDSTTAFTHKILCTKDVSKILILGNSELAKKVKMDLADLDASIDTTAIAGINYDIVLGCNIKTETLSENDLVNYNYQTIFLDAGIGNFSENFIRASLEKGSTILRIDHRASLSASLISILETHDLFENVMGTFNYEGIRIVAGGIMGKKGDIVVDNAKQPKMIIGIANGAGKIVYPPYSEEDQNKLNIIRNLIRHSHE